MTNKRREKEKHTKLFMWLKAWVTFSMLLNFNMCLEDLRPILQGKHPTIFVLHNYWKSAERRITPRMSSQMKQKCQVSVVNDRVVRFRMDNSVSGMHTPTRSPILGTSKELFFNFIVWWRDKIDRTPLCALFTMEYAPSRWVIFICVALIS